MLTSDIMLAERVVAITEGEIDTKKVSWFRIINRKRQMMLNQKIRYHSIISSSLVNLHLSYQNELSFVGLLSYSSSLITKIFYY